MTTINISNATVQASELFLQAAGSTDSGTTIGLIPGIHLRWTFRGQLGDHHLPKGNLNPEVRGYNKPEDFVEIYRAAHTPFINRAVLDSLDSTPRVDNVSQTVEIDVPMAGAEELMATVHFKFLNHFGYNPSTPITNYLNSYNGIVEFSIKNQLMYETRFDFSGSNLQLEAVAVQGNDNRDVRL